MHLIYTGSIHALLLFLIDTTADTATAAAVVIITVITGGGGRLQISFATDSPRVSYQI